MKEIHVILFHNVFFEFLLNYYTPLIIYKINSILSTNKIIFKYMLRIKVLPLGESIYADIDQ